MRTLRFLFPGILVLAMSAPALGDGPVSLVRIEKGTAGLEAILKSEAVTVVQELRTCYLGRLDREETLALRRRGIRVLILDREPASKTYLLVRADSARTQEALAAKGLVVVLEPGLLLFRAAAGEAAGFLPPNVARRRLPEASITAGLRTYPGTAGSGRAAVVDVLIERLVERVSDTNLRAYVRSLTDLKTRYTYSPNSAAAASLILNHFLRQGMNAALQPVVLGGGNQTQNVVAEITGQVYPDDVVLVCAHYDSTSQSPSTLAPGADDNASGTAAVMEAARILAPYPMDFTVRFVAFGAEEQGLYGSEAYAGAMKISGERVVGVVNLDMIGYADRMPEDLDIVVNVQSDWLGEKLSLDAALYAGLSVNKTIDPSMIFSDHASFWQNGFPALIGIDDEPLMNPYYHGTGDLPGTLNYGFLGQAAKTALATVAGLGQLVKSGYPQTPSDLSGVSSFFSSFLGKRKNTYLSWPKTPGAAGYNIYRTESSHLDYQKVNDQLVKQERFSDRGVTSGEYHYYVITAVDAAGLESNFSREIEISPLPAKSGS
jgi:hypothetical protein